MTATAVLLDTPLAPDASSVPRCRHLVADHLRRSGYNVDTDAVLLLISEVVTNALVHGHPPLALRVLVLESHAGLRVEVSDGESDFPWSPGTPELTATGRGLVLVQALASRWGWYPDEAEPRGKVVWFEVGASA